MQTEKQPLNQLITFSGQVEISPCCSPDTFREALIAMAAERGWPIIVKTEPAKDWAPEALQEETEVLVGTLGKKFGLNHYKPAEVGSPVYKLKDRYVIYLDPINPSLPKYRVPFYMEDLTVNLNP